MKAFTFFNSAYGFMTYFSSDKELYFLPAKANVDQLVLESYRRRNSSGGSLQFLGDPLIAEIFFQELKSGKDKESSRFFINSYLDSVAYKENSCLAAEDFGSVHFEYECKLLIDILHCVCVNGKKVEAEIRSYENRELSVLNVYKKLSGLNKLFTSSRGDHLWSLPLAQLESYVATNTGLTLRLRDGSFAYIEDAIDKDLYPSTLNEYKINLKKFFFNQ